MLGDFTNGTYICWGEKMNDQAQNINQATAAQPDKATPELTAEQKQVLSQLIDFVSSKAQVFILRGYAGTGKTTLMRHLADFLEERKHPARYMTPTGRAAKVLTERIRRSAYTIHKSIYIMEKLCEERSLVGIENDLKYYFALRLNTDPVDTIYVIDEASMLSNQSDESDYYRFGSGYLLHDLFTYVNSGSRGNRRKLVFIGDDAQIPPVNMSFSPALDKTYIQQEYPDLIIWEAELKTVIRQNAQSGIIRAATRLRKALEEDYYTAFEVETNDPDITEVSAQRFMEYYLNAGKKQLTDAVIVVTYTNMASNGYNQLIRRHFFSGEASLFPGERIIVAQNNYHYAVELMNGEFGVVRQVASEPEQSIVTLQTRNGEKQIRLKFRDLVIEFNIAPEKVVGLKVKVIENLLDSRSGSLSREEIQALLIDFKKRHSDLKPNSPAYLEILRNDPYLNALRIKYGYAITCHKAQGGEWPHVFVDFSHPTSPLCRAYFRWAYTAISRAKTNLYLLNYTAISPNESLAAANNKQTEQKHSSTIQSQPAIIPEPSPIKTQIEAIIRQLGWQINNCISRPYRLRYWIEKSGVYFRFDVVYRKNQRISDIEFRKLPEAAQTVVQALRELATGVGQAPAGAVDFPADKPFLAEFYRKIEAELQPTGATISSVLHYPFHEKYVVRHEMRVTEMHVYYNKNGRITSIQSEDAQLAGLQTSIMRRSRCEK